MRRIKKYFQLPILIILVFVVLLSSACSFSDGVKKAAVGTVNSNYGSSNFRIYDKSVSERILSDGYCTLYLDKKSGGISFYNNYTSIGFESLPDFSNSFAASFIVSIFDGENIHYLDTSLHCAENKGMSTAVENNTLTVTYEMKKDDITLVLPVKFSLDETFMEVSISLSECVLSEGETLLSVAVLPYLGAVRYDSAGVDYSAFSDYYLVPDGVGALMFTAVEDENKSAVYSVYGKEYFDETIPCSLGAYGIKKGDSALSVTVTKGSENALINVKRANADEEQINRIYPEFIVTPISGISGNINIGESFLRDISVTYEMLSDDSADYIGIATSVRQTLIRNGFLSSKTAPEEYPLFVTVTGSVDGSKKETVTSFQQAENLLSILKGKGINNINMILEGAFSGGIKEDASSKIRISPALGSKDDLKELLSYASTQKMRVYAGVNLLTADGFVNGIKGISGEKSEYIVKNELFPYIGEESFTLSYLGVNELSKSTKNAVSLLSEYDFSGLCLLDSSDAASAELSLKGDCYKGYSDKLNSSLSAISSKTSVMLTGSSFNIIKNADYLDSVVLFSNNETTGSYTEVPFIPAVLHGSVIYSGRAVNTDAFPRIQLLKSVEYGALPSYIWNFSSYSDKYYENTLSEAVDFYLRAEEDLSSLSSKRITEHFLYADGVYCTGYEGGVRVYVNYNNFSVIIGEVAVMPYDYLRIG